MKKYKTSNSRITTIGNRVLFDTFDKPVRYGYTQKTVRGKRDPDKLRDEEACLRRTRKLLRDLVLANFGQYRDSKGRIMPSIFLTLTFAENMQDEAKANKLYHAFIQRLIYLTKTSLKCINIHERQKRGAIHFHVICFNLPYIENIHEVVSKCWGHGYIFITVINDVNKLTNYVLKYLQKEIVVGKYHTKNKRRFLTSKGLLRPLSTLDENIIRIVLENVPKPLSVEHGEFTDFEGRTTRRMTIELPEGSNLSQFIPQNTIKLAKDIFDSVK